MATREEDRTLAARVVGGEPGAAEELFEQIFDPLYHQVCARLGGDHHVAQDVVSESLTAGLRALAQFRGDATLATWFFRIATRKIADLKRRRAIAIVSNGDGELEVLLSGSRPRGPSSLDHLAPLDRLADEETRGLVQAALEALPAGHRVVLESKYFDDSSLRQLAARLRVTAKAAERRLARARQALAGELRRRGVHG